MRGEITVNQILSEPRGGSDLAAQTTTALRNGACYLVNGEKGYASAGYPPDYLFILVITDPEGPKYENLAMIIVDAQDPGISTRQRRTFMGTLQNSFVLEDVWVPAANTVGGERGGWQVAQTILDLERGGAGVTVDQRRKVEERERVYWGGNT